MISTMSLSHLVASLWRLCGVFAGRIVGHVHAISPAVQVKGSNLSPHGPLLLDIATLVTHVKSGERVLPAIRDMTHESKNTEMHSK